MKEMYEELEIEVIAFLAEDIICNSGGGGITSDDETGAGEL